MKHRNDFFISGLSTQYTDETVCFTIFIRFIFVYRSVGNQKIYQLYRALLQNTVVVGNSIMCESPPNVTGEEIIKGLDHKWKFCIDHSK